MNFEITGFPGDDDKFDELWGMRSSSTYQLAQMFQNEQIWYDKQKSLIVYASFDTTPVPGQSGSPILASIYDKANSGCSETDIEAAIIGIHSAGGYENNYGTRITGNLD